MSTQGMTTQGTITPAGKITAIREGGIGWLIFDNPARHNAISQDMWLQAEALLNDFESDPEIRIAIMKGAGDKAFVAGADISQFSKTLSDGEAARRTNEITGSARAKFASFRKPLIAMINGYCIGAGMAIATRADIRIAAEGSTFAIPAARLGLGYIFEAARQLVDLVGPGFAKDIMFSARKLGTDEALRIGLINRIAPAGELEQVTREYAALLLANAPLSMQSSKLAINEALKDPAERDMERVEAEIWGCFDSEDFAEGRKAFMEKRSPMFKGS